MTAARSLFVAVTLALLGCASNPQPVTAPSAPPTARSTPASGDAAGDDGGDLAALSSDQLARRLLDVTGAADTGRQIIEAMAAQMKKTPGLPEGFMERFVANARMDDLTAFVASVYIKHLDRETMIATIRFYQSKAGRAFVAQMPQMIKETTEAGAEWGRRMAARTLREMGYGDKAK